VVFLLSYDSFVSIDNSSECSYSLGADRRRTFFRIELPLAIPGIVTGLYMALMTAFTDFGTPYIISLDLNTLPVLIYKEFMSEVGGNYSIASTGSVVMVLLSSGILLVQRLYLAKRSYASIKTQQPSARMPSAGKKVAIEILTLALIAMAFVPHITVLVTSFFKWEAGILSSIPTWENFVRLFNLSLNSIWVTLTTGTAATFLTFAVGIGIAYVIVKKRYPFFGQALNILVMIPYIIPGTVSRSASSHFQQAAPSSLAHGSSSSWPISSASCPTRSKAPSQPCTGFTRPSRKPPEASAPHPRRVSGMSLSRS